MQRRYRLLQTYAEAFGPSAAEDEISGVIEASLGDYFNFSRTPHGNLIVWKKEQRSKRGRKNSRKRVLMLQAHMDELGFRPFRYLPDGFIKVSPLSPLPDNVANHPIRFWPGDKEGLLIVTKEDGLKRYYLDVGARNAEEAEKEIPYFAVGAYSSVFGFSQSEFTCKSFDDRAGCALVAEGLLESYDDEDTMVVGVFTTREETGSWPIPELLRQLHYFDIHPDLMINLEVCPGGPTPSNPKPIAEVGKGVGLVHMDKFYAAPSDVCRFMVKIAEREEVPFQHVAMRDGGGELGTLAFQLGVRSYGFVIPGRYMHSPHSVISRFDFDAAHGMVMALLKNFHRLDD